MEAKPCRVSLFTNSKFNIFSIIIFSLSYFFTLNVPARLKFICKLYVKVIIFHIFKRNSLSKSVRIRYLSGPCFPAFQLSMEICRVNLGSQSKFRKIRTRKTPKTDNFHAATFVKNFHVLFIICTFLYKTLVLCHQQYLLVRSAIY